MIQPARAQLPDWRDQEARDNLAAQPSTPGVQATYPTAYDRRQDRLARQGMPPDFGNKTTDIPTLMASGAARSLLTLPQRAMDASRESFKHKFGPGPASISDSDPPWRDPLPDVAAETAMLMMGGAPAVAERAAAGVGGRLAESVGDAARMLESRSAKLYDPPVKPPRPFEADYPGGGVPDGSGKLKFDIDGRPLVAAHISGRRVVRGADEAILPSEYAAISEGSIGTVHQARSARELPDKAVGIYHEIRGPDGPERSIGYLKTLTPSAAEKVISHELGHAIDELAGQIPTAGLNSELRQIFNTLNTGQERSTHLTGPQHMG